MGKQHLLEAHQSSAAFFLALALSMRPLSSFCRTDLS